MSIDDVLTMRSDGGVRIVTMNRPAQGNATNAELHTALATVWTRIQADSEARVTVLTGSGQTFCAGGDLDWLEQLAVDPLERRRVLLEAREIMLGMAECRLPIVAAVNGPAVGLGFSLAVLCDMVYVAEEAFFMDPHVALGLPAADGIAMALGALTSLSRVKELLLLGERISAVDAASAGIANGVTPREEVLPTAIGVAARLADLSPNACQETKRSLNRELVQSITAAVDHLLAVESECFTSAEHRQALGRLRRQSGSGA